MNPARVKLKDGKVHYHMENFDTQERDRIVEVSLEGQKMQKKNVNRSTRCSPRTAWVVVGEVGKV